MFVHVYFDSDYIVPFDYIIVVHYILYIVIMIYCIVSFFLFLSFFPLSHSGSLVMCQCSRTSKRFTAAHPSNRHNYQSSSTSLPWHLRTRPRPLNSSNQLSRRAPSSLSPTAVPRSTIPSSRYSAALP